MGAWHRRGPAGLPLFRVPHLLACCGGVTKRARPAREAPMSATRSGGGIDDSARSGIVASELRTPRERGEPERLLRGGSPEEISSGAGLGRREAQKLGFSIGPLLFRKAPVQWKTFQGAGVQRVGTLWRRGLGTARVPSGFGTAPTVGGWRCGVAVLARPPAQRVALGPQTTLPGGAAGTGP